MKTWTNSPCDVTEDAIVLYVFSFRGTNSFVIRQSNDIVREIGTPLNSGVTEINFQRFIYSNNITNINRSTIVNGALTWGNFYLSGSCSFKLSSGAQLHI